MSKGLQGVGFGAGGGGGGLASFFNPNLGNAPVFNSYDPASGAPGLVIIEY